VAADEAEAAAFEAIVRQHGPRVRQQLRRLAWPDEALADELAQDTFVQAWRALPDFRGEAQLSTWLHRIALSRWLMQRRRAVLPELPLDALGDGAEGAAPGADVALQVDLERAMARLPLHERIAVVHCLQLEMSHEEAAGVLGLPLGTVKSQVARGKARLREWLADWQAERGER
jgi:RNA polymerase sigma factor (sigma-70 family)